MSQWLQDLELLLVQQLVMQLLLQLVAQHLLILGVLRESQQEVIQLPLQEQISLEIPMQGQIKLLSH